uniref:Soluble scavenger receptor cysteine-rich domain-containing protein SSC5D n=1 Tax=Pelusios castaneus TaxID=367368 RepID=A0A8C8SRP4_9SAUR
MYVPLCVPLLRRVYAPLVCVPVCVRAPMYPPWMCVCVLPVCVSPWMYMHAHASMCVPVCVCRCLWTGGKERTTQKPCAIAHQPSPPGVEAVYRALLVPAQLSHLGDPSSVSRCVWGRGVPWDRAACGGLGWSSGTLRMGAGPPGAVQRGEGLMGQRDPERGVVGLTGCAVPAGPFRVRLAEGPSGCAGRVEINYKGQWGSVCDDEWDLADAAVVCRQLDCGAVLSAPVGSWFGEGTGPIWLNEVRCQGSESHLHHCRHRGWRQHVCTHEEDASAVCSGGARGALLRLVGGPHSCAGRLEVLHGGQWGSVCDDGWGLPEGMVVCRELGCGVVQATPGGAHFGTGTGPIWLDDVGCTGKEMSLQRCRARPWGRSNCQHDEDAGVICTGGAVLRLVGGAGPCSGRLEVFHQSRWGTVCDDRWALPSAAVVCRELSCGDALSAPGGAFFGEGSGPIWLDNVRCQGNESALSQCLAAPWGVHDCQHAEDAGVVCTGNVCRFGLTIPVQQLQGPENCKVGKVLPKGSSNTDDTEEVYLQYQYQ